MDEIIDRSTIDELRSLDDDGTALKEVLILFLRTSESAVTHLLAQLAARDFASAAQIAHQLKSTAATVGADQLSAIFIELESACLSAQAPLVEACQMKLTPCYLNSKQALQHILESEFES